MILREIGKRKKLTGKYITWTSSEFQKDGETHLLCFNLYDCSQRAYHPSINLTEGGKFMKEILPQDAMNYELLEANEITRSNLKTDGFYFYDKNRQFFLDFISYLKESGASDLIGLKLLDSSKDAISKWYQKEGLPFIDYFLPFAADQNKGFYAAWYRLGKNKQAEEDLILYFGQNEKIEYSALNYKDFFTDYLFHQRGHLAKIKNQNLKKFLKNLKTKWNIEIEKAVIKGEQPFGNLELVYEDWLSDFLKKTPQSFKKPFQAEEHQPQIPARR